MIIFQWLLILALVVPVIYFGNMMVRNIMDDLHIKKLNIFKPFDKEQDAEYTDNGSYVFGDQREEFYGGVDSKGVPVGESREDMLIRKFRNGELFNGKNSHDRHSVGSRSDDRGYDDYDRYNSRVYAGGEKSYSDRGGYNNRGGYAGRGNGYDNRGGYDNRSGYDDYDRYDNRGGNDDYDRYDNRGGYSDYDRYDNRGGYDNRSGYDEHDGYTDSGYMGKADSHGSDDSTYEYYNYDGYDGYNGYN